MKKSFWIYGVTMGLLLLLLQIIHYKTMIRDFQLEIFGFFIALLFLSIGIWVGVSIYNKTQQLGSRRNLSQRQIILSDRELDVLELMADGLSNQEIADRLFVSLNTTKTHISNIFQKLDVKRRTQAVQKALNTGILRSPKSTIRKNHSKG